MERVEDLEVAEDREVLEVDDLEVVERREVLEVEGLVEEIELLDTDLLLLVLLVLLVLLLEIDVVPEEVPFLI